MMKLDSFKWCLVTRQGAWVQTGTQKVPSEHEEEFHCEGPEALELAAQRGHVVPFSREIAKLPGHFDPGQAAMGGPALARILA